MASRDAGVHSLATDHQEKKEVPREHSISLHSIRERPKTSLQHAARDGREDVVRQYLARLPKYNKHKVLNGKDSEGYSAVHYAAKFNRLKILQLLVDSGADPEVRTTDEKLTALHLAARYVPCIQCTETEEQERQDSQAKVTSASTSRRVAQLLIVNYRVDVNARDLYGESPLHVACSRGNLAALEEFLKAPDIDLNITDNNQDTPLHEACLLGNKAIVETLLEGMKEKGLNQVTLNDEEKTPLHLACKKGYADVVKCIFQFEFDKKKELVEMRDSKGNTPLHLACESGNKEIAHILCQYGADVEAHKEGDIMPLHIAARYGFVEVAKVLLTAKKEIVDCTNMYQQTPLHYAAQYNQCDMINYLLDQGADIEALDQDSYSPLLTAAAHGQTLALRKLIDRGAPLEAVDKDGKSAVFIAAEENHTAVLQELISHPTGKKLGHSVDSIHNTPLHIAAQVGNIEAVRMLLRVCVKVDAKNEINKSPMHLAAENGHVPVVRELIRYQADTVQDEDEDSNTPLHLACHNGHLAVAKVLINANCDVEARNALLRTPMDCAADGGYDELVTLLIDSDADVDPTDKTKVTPLQIASREGHLEVVNVLLMNGADVSNTDHNGNNALDLAIENGHKAVALAIINSPKWESALRNTTRAQYGGVTTPLRKLIRKMPEVAEEVFNKCTVTNATKDGTIRPDSREYRVYFNYEFLEDFRDRGPRGLFGRYFRRVAHTVSDSEDEEEDQSDTQSLVSDKLKSSDDAEEGRVDMITKLQARKGHNFTTSWGPVGFRKSRHPLSIMVDSEQINLLKHPLVTSLLQYKWRTYGRYVYFGNLFIYIFFLIFLTSFALLVPNPETETCRAVLDGTFGNNTEDGMSLPTNTAEQRDIVDGKCDSVLSTSTRNYLYFAAVIVLLSSVIRVGMELFQMVQLRVWRYFLSWVNLIELLLFLFSIIFAVTFATDCFCPYIWQWQIGAFAIFLGWIDLIVFFRILPWTGIYVVMFVDILFTFCRLLFLSALLVIAFSLTFYMTFYEPELTPTSFSTPGRSILKTVTMTTGEYVFDNIFRQAPGGLGIDEVNRHGTIPYLPVSYILWIVFIILMPVLLTNLLVGLAVDDIKGILETAVLKRHAMQVELVLSVEEQFTRRLRRWFIIGSREISPNRDLSLWEKFRYSAWGGQRYQSSEKISNALHPPPTPIEQQTHTLLTEMNHMKQTMSALSERNQMLEEMVKALVSHQGIQLSSEFSPGPHEPQERPPSGSFV